MIFFYKNICQETALLKLTEKLISKENVQAAQLYTHTPNSTSIVISQAKPNCKIKLCLNTAKKQAEKKLLQSKPLKSTIPTKKLQARIQVQLKVLKTLVYLIQLPVHKNPRFQLLCGAHGVTVLRAGILQPVMCVLQ